MEVRAGTKRYTQTPSARDKKKSNQYAAVDFFSMDCLNFHEDNSPLRIKKFKQANLLKLLICL